MYTSKGVEIVGAVDAKASRRRDDPPLTLDVDCLGSWQTPWWENGVDHGPKMRADFVATGRLNRHDSA